MVLSRNVRAEMPRRCDLWRIGIVPAAIDAVVARGGIEGLATHWLAPEPTFTFLADPFGLWRDGVLHVFAEQYDYRTRHGIILCLRFDEALRPLGREVVLSEPWHLSYPFVFEADGETWMLPEAHRSGTLALYRATRFPDRWQQVATLPQAHGAVDATPVRHEGRWWLFYAAAGTRRRRTELHAAFADRLEGPWHAHPGNPVRIDRLSARPGGTPFLADGTLVLPVQDCTATYGGAIRPLRFARLDPEVIATSLGTPIVPPTDAAPYRAGLHTLSACGAVTLVDVKRIDRSGRGWLIDLRRAARRLIG